MMDQEYTAIADIIEAQSEGFISDKNYYDA